MRQSLPALIILHVILSIPGLIVLQNPESRKTVVRVCAMDHIRWKKQIRDD